MFITAEADLELTEHADPQRRRDAGSIAFVPPRGHDLSLAPH